MDVQISSDGGTIVRHLDDIDAIAAEYSTFSWDGRDDEGAVVPDGVYAWSLTATDEDGGTGAASGELGVLSALPGAVTSPAAGLDIQRAIRHGLRARRGLCHGAGELLPLRHGRRLLTSDRPTGMTPAVRGKLTTDEENRPQGEWRLAADVRWVDPFNVEHSYRTAEVPVTIADPLRVTIRPTPRATGSSPPSEQFENSFRLNRTAHVTATIADADGTVVRTLLDEPDAAPDRYGLEWDGRGEGHLVALDPAECDPEEEGDCLSGSTLTCFRRATTSCGCTLPRRTAREHDAVQPVRIERRPGGELLTPRPGDTLSRHQAFVFQAATDFPQPVLYVRICVAGECQGPDWSPDGIYRAAFDTTGFENGEAEVAVTVGFGYNGGEIVQADHIWRGTSTVTISDVAPEVTLTADPATGDVPLATTLKIDATDTAGPLAYTLRYGDGSDPVTGTIAPPYADELLTHTYRHPGVHHANVIVTDQDGNSAQRTVDVVATGVFVPPPGYGTLELRATTAAVNGRGPLQPVDRRRPRQGRRAQRPGLGADHGPGGHACGVLHQRRRDCCDDQLRPRGSRAVTERAMAPSSPRPRRSLVNVPVAGGEHIVCTILNTRRTQRLEVQSQGRGRGRGDEARPAESCAMRWTATATSRWGARSGSPACRHPARRSSTGPPNRRATAPATARSRSIPASPSACTQTSTRSKLKAVAGEDLRGVDDSPIAFDGNASRPASRIEHYRWDFGDGASATTSRAHAHLRPPGFLHRHAHRQRTHRRRRPRPASTTIKVRVDEHDDGSGLRLTVGGPGGPIGGADVVVNDAGGDRMQDVTDGNGRARLRGLVDGHHTVYVNAPGYVPAVKQAEIVDGTGHADRRLRAGRAGRRRCRSA